MRNKSTAGLIAAAKNKHAAAVKRATDAITSMIESNEIITFSSVARKANLTKAWLYREASMREKINLLKNHQHNTITPDTNAKNVTDYSYVLSLENKIIQLEENNKDLKKQIEIMYGKFFTRCE